ncbi:hypothetical protein BKA65DRAFT_559761 [Rhexocercosporidium sp. MPI-PUGE-AT-0058]|nr:hypothetical protein BKA65DRAFT_559761 [Rhexocercosporidium sp. MPI-PUGE-AT-0058]
MVSPDDTEKPSPSSEPRTPTRCAHPRPRSLTMIPYIHAEMRDKSSEKVSPNEKKSQANANTRLPSPTPSHLSPFPDFFSDIEPTLELEKETSSLTAPSPPLRAESPLPGNPFVTDAESLQNAVSEDPGRILEAIQNLVDERDSLRANLVRTAAELQSATEDLTHTRVDHKAARHRYEELFRVASAKQVILWKYIESLHKQIATAKGQPDPQVGAGNGLGLFMGTRGGLGMGVAMEKWISEGMDGDRGSRVGEEGSEKGTEHSFLSSGDSVSTRSLDPNAQAFIPQSSSGSPQKPRQRSPGNLSQDRSPDPSSYRQNPSTSTKYTSYAIQAHLKDQQQALHTLQAIKLPANSLQPVLPPHSLIAPLPPRWYGICPHSLAQADPCPLGLKCQFTVLCPLYNNLDGDGCPLFNMGGASACRFAHEYRFCEDAPLYHGASQEEKTDSYESKST